jgi:hypothetical protein
MDKCVVSWRTEEEIKWFVFYLLDIMKKMKEEELYFMGEMKK